MNLYIRKLLINNYTYIFLLIICFIYVGVFTIIIKNKSVISETETEFIGTINEFSIDGNTLSMIVNSKEKLKALYYFPEESEKLDYEKKLAYGIKIKLIGKLSKPINNTIPNTFNYKKYLYNKKINYILIANKIEVLDQRVSIFNQIKNMIKLRATKFITKDYLLTFILGDKTLLDDETLENYRKIGVTHLFAISGMHINLFALIIMFFLKKLKVKENYRYYTVIIFLVFYSFLTNYTSSILRSALFYSLISLNKIFYTEIKNINLCFLTIIILLFINPFLIYDLGFIYSVVTCLGLIIGSKYLNKGNYFIKLFKVSFISFLFSLPITLNNFFEINILSVLNNIFYVPFITVIVYPISLIVFVFSFLEPILITLINISEYLSYFFSEYSINVIIPKVNIILYFFYYILIICYLNGHKKLLYIALVIIMLPKLSPYFNANYELYFLDVGQGDAMLIRSPYNKENIMIDVGGKIKYERDSWEEKNKKSFMVDNIIIFLKSIGVEYLDVVISSHGDEDHIGDLPQMIDNYLIKFISLNKGNFNDLEKLIVNKSIPIISEYKAKYINLKYLNTSITNDENSNSQIILLNINDHQILLLGDAPKSQELELLRKYNITDIDILKIAHHGSKTSTDENFILKINPKLSIISSGRNNRFKHPALETIQTLQKNNFLYFNTQTSGTIKFILSKIVSYQTFPP